MARARRSVRCPRDPLGLSLEEAAAFLGLSASLFARAVKEQMMPRPRRIFGRLVFDADEIIAAYRRLPREGDSAETGEVSDCWGDVAL